MNRKKREAFTGYIFVAPITILFAVFIIYPILYNIKISFYDWNGIDLVKKFCGFDNYIIMFKDPVML